MGDIKIGVEGGAFILNTSVFVNVLGGEKGRSFFSKEKDSTKYASSLVLNSIMS